MHDQEDEAEPGRQSGASETNPVDVVEPEVDGAAGEPVEIDPPDIFVDPPEGDPDGEPVFYDPPEVPGDPYDPIEVDPDDDNPIIDPRPDGRPGLEEIPFEAPEAPIDLRAIRLGRDRVEADSDAADLRLTEVEARADDGANEANDDTPPAEKESLYTKVMTGIMGIGAAAAIPGAILGIMSYIERKANGQAPPPKPEYEITAWLSLTDQQALKKLGNFVKDQKLDYAKQFLVLNLLVRTRLPDEKKNPAWNWPATAKLAFVDALAAKPNDHDMYFTMAVSQYGKRLFPFSVAAEVIRLALTKKYHLN
jgi:hypothetical protein